MGNPSSSSSENFHVYLPLPHATPQKTNWMYAERVNIRNHRFQMGWLLVVPCAPDAAFLAETAIMRARLGIIVEVACLPLPRLIRLKTRLIRLGSLFSALLNGKRRIEVVLSFGLVWLRLVRVEAFSDLFLLVTFWVRPPATTLITPYKYDQPDVVAPGIGK